MARQSQGYDTLIAIAKEDTFGVAPADAKFGTFGLITSFEPEENKNHEVIRGLGSRKAQMIKALQFEVSSSASMYLQNPKVIYHALGKATKSGSAGAYIHTITPMGRCEELPTSTWQRNVCAGGAPYVQNYVGTKIDTLTISGSAGEAVEVEAEMIHKTILDGTALASAYPVDLSEIMTFAEGEITINGVKTANVTEFELEIANNLEALYAIAKGNSASLINEGVLDITGSFTFAFTDKTQVDLFKAGTPFNVKLRFDDPIVPNNYIEINVTAGKYDTNAINTSSDEGIEQELEAIFTDISVTAGSATIADLTV